MKKLYALFFVMALMFWAGIASATSFTADGQATDVISVDMGDTVYWTASTDNSSAVIEIQSTSTPSSGNWIVLQSVSSETQSGSILNEGAPKWYRVYCKDFKTGATMTGTISSEAKPLAEWRDKAGSTVLRITDKVVYGSTVSHVYRGHIAIADINAGKTLLPALVGYKYRIVSVKAIAIGGNASAVTTVDILGTQSSSSVKIVAFAQASLTRSAVLSAGGTGGTVLADGASFAACDANTAITVLKNGSDVATSTYIDFIIEYVLET